MQTAGITTPGAVDQAGCLRPGNADDFARLYEATAARVHGLVLRVVLDPAQSEEVTQESYLEVWQKAGRYDPELGSTSTWLAKIAHGKAVDRVRSVVASRRRDSSDYQRSRQVAYDQTAEAVEVSLEAQALRVALGSLTPDQRQAIELAYFCGYTYAEVSQHLGIPVGTVKYRIRQGLIRLRTALCPPPG